MDGDDHARDRRADLDRRLVGHDFGQVLIFLDDIADINQPGDDLSLGDAFADIGQSEQITPHG
ncbi:hypothetical protein D3C73_1427390 [compost metagenome]